MYRTVKAEAEAGRGRDRQTMTEDGQSEVMVWPGLASAQPHQTIYTVDRELIVYGTRLVTSSGPLVPPYLRQGLPLVDYLD